MIQYNANHPNKSGKKHEGRNFGPYTITTLDNGSVTLLGGDSTRPDPETLDRHRPAQKDFKGESIGDINSQSKERSF